MAASPSLNKLHHQDPDQEYSLIPMKTHSKSIKNFILLILVLAVLPFFPSQAPDFISQTPFTKVWDLIYLLFIGIVVCYGLFSRRAVKVHTEIVSPNLVNFNPQIWSPLNGISHISSIFENGFENSCGFDDLRMPQIFSPFPKSLYSHGCSVSNGSDSLRSSVVNGGFGNFSGSNGKKVSGVSASRSSLGENMVVDQIGKPKLSIECKPSLGLPIRSLRSGNLDCDNIKSSDLSGSSLRFKDSCNGGQRVESGVKGLVPTNLDGKFKEEVAPSPIPWRSRSTRIEMSSVEPPSNFGSTSGGDFVFEPKPQSLRTSIPSHTSSKHTSSGVPSAVPSVLIDLEKPKMKDLKGKEKFDDSRAQEMQPKLAPLSGISLTRSLNTRHISIGSTSEMNMQMGSKDDNKDLRRSKMDNLDSSMKPPALGNTRSKGELPNANGISSARSLNTRHISIGSTSEMNMQMGSKDDIKDLRRVKVDNLDSSSKPPALGNTRSKGELPNAKMQDLKGKGKFNGPRQQPKHPSLNSVTGDGLFKNSNTRSLSMGSSAEVKLNGVENYLKDFLESRVDDKVFEKEKNVMEFSKLSQKPTTPINGYTPGKSVRTIRSSEKEKKVSLSSINNIIGSKFEEGSGLEHMATDTSRVEHMATDTRKETPVMETKFETFDMSSDKEKEDGSDMYSDAEPHSGEVDRKADEFIAKFKEQIRLQKVSSRRLKF